MKRRHLRVVTRSSIGLVALSCSLALAGCKKKDNAAAGNATSSSKAAVSGATKAVKSPSGKDTAPSTGKEMPAAGTRLPTKAEARAALNTALSAAQKPGHNCAQIIQPRTRVYLGIAAPTLAEVKANLPGFVALTRCAEARSYFTLMFDLCKLMIDAADADGHPELLARALFGLGETKYAVKVLEVFAKKNPKDSNVSVTFAKILCGLDLWDACYKQSDMAFRLSLGERDPAEKQAVGARAKKYLARALLHVGRIDDAARAADASEKLGGDKKDLDEIRQQIVPARNFHTLVDVDTEREVDLGTYHLLGKATDVGSLVRVSIDNIDREDKQFRVEVELSGVTQRGSQTLTILKGQSQKAQITPPIKPDFNISATRAKQAAQVSVKVTSIGAAGEKVVYDQAIPISVQPRDQLPLWRFISQERDENTSTRTPGFIGAWVTPNAKAVDAFLGQAKKRAPGATFSGEQSATIPQVKALFDELQARGVSYVMDPDVTSEETFSQRTRLPAEVLTSGNAQCIEGAILYATLFEAIGLKPSVILVPGHAFVAWRPVPKDGVKSALVFLETTMTHSAPFEKAMEYAANEFAEHSQNKAATVVDIPRLRSLGFTPQPYD